MLVATSSLLEVLKGSVIDASRIWLLEKSSARQYKQLNVFYLFQGINESKFVGARQVDRHWCHLTVRGSIALYATRYFLSWASTAVAPLLAKLRYVLS